MPGIMWRVMGLIKRRTAACSSTITSFFPKVSKATTTPVTNQQIWHGCYREKYANKVEQASVTVNIRLSLNDLSPEMDQRESSWYAQSHVRFMKAQLTKISTMQNLFGILILARWKSSAPYANLQQMLERVINAQISDDTFSTHLTSGKQIMNHHLL